MAEKSLKAIAVIPARLASTRLPRKMLREIAGKPLIGAVYDAVRSSPLLADVLVATDSEEIISVCRERGWKAQLTSAAHRSGTERVHEISNREAADIYINVQGDEPLIDPGTVDAVAAAMAEDDAIQLATPCAAITQPNEIMDPNVVKVVLDFDGQALYFSRAPIPWVRDTGDRVAARHWKHIGLYGYRRDALLEFPTLPPGELERIEQLEQLRWLENGFHMHVVETSYNAVSVDVRGDIDRVEKLLQARAKSSSQASN
jgi:3-deoxy-manno-octulosonate cytidylyltransferase (CMP-KDO synthetase)